MLQACEYSRKDDAALAAMLTLATEVQLRIAEIENTQSRVDQEPGCMAYLESMRQAAASLGARASGILEYWVKTDK